MANIYQYGGFTFEYHSYCGPMKLKKNFDPAKKDGVKFYKVVAKWDKLTKKEKQATKISG